MYLSDVFQERIRYMREKREREYFENVKIIAESGLEPTHGPHGSDMGRGVSGYILKGKFGVVYVKDEDVEKYKLSQNSDEGAL